MIGVDTIKDNIDIFDMGFNTKYDAISLYPANNSYHYTHITQFKVLYSITNDKFFKIYANQFENYFNSFSSKFKTLILILKLDIESKLGLK